MAFIWDEKNSILNLKMTTHKNFGVSRGIIFGCPNDAEIEEIARSTASRPRSMRLLCVYRPQLLAKTSLSADQFY